MKIAKWVALGLGGLILAGAAIWWGMRGTRAGADESGASEESQSAVPVSTAGIRAGTISQTITVYGNVTAEPGGILILSAAVECRVRRLRVAGGQALDPGAPVIEIEPSPDVRLQLIDARNALESAKKDAASQHQRLTLKLATTTEVRTADDAVTSAQAKFDDLMHRGAGEDHKVLKTDAAALVARVDVQEGQLVAAGAPLVELVSPGQIEVRLGVDTPDALLLKPGQSAQLFPSQADGDDLIQGTIRLITQRVNADSRLVDVFVSPAETNGLLLDQFISSKLAIRNLSGLIVPRAALLPEGEGFAIFTVANQHAIKHAVKVALQNQKEAVIVGDGLHEGDAVVVGGNLELDDKAPVIATAATTAAADSEGEK